MEDGAHLQGMFETGILAVNGRVEMMVSEAPFNSKVVSSYGKVWVWHLYILHLTFVLIQKHLCEHQH